MFVILHGSWQASEGWQTVGNLLQGAGFRAHLLDLPGHGSHAGMNFQKINLQTYVNYVCEQVQDLQKNAPLVLVGHSMAGMVISQVAQNLPVEHLIYISAFLPVDGECLLDIARRSHIIGISKNMIMNPKQKTVALDKNGLDKLFYHDCTPTVRDLALSRLQEEPLLPFYGCVRLTEEKFGQVPKSYIECLKDFSISIELQRFMHQRWKCEIHSLDAGHSPHYSVPEQLAQTLLSCVKDSL
jgi:pimeloyl-ACP methyl ester carboxylesterase